MQRLKRIIHWLMQLLATAVTREILREGWKFLKQLLREAEQ
jgi:hypothetical protein